MKIQRLILLWIGLISISNLYVFANPELEHINYNWNENPTLTNYTVKDTNEAFVSLKSFESHEFIDEDDVLIEYVLIHKHVKVFTERGIERFNKLYLPVYDDGAFLIEKARVINSKGEIIELQNSDVKEGVDEESKRKYRYFALDGIDRGSEVEYIYMYRTSPNLSGLLKDIQSSELQLEYDMEMITPNRLKLDFKVYNDDKTFEIDTTTAMADKNKSRWFIHYDSLTGLSKERSSAYSSELIYFGFKVSANYASNLYDLYSYGQLSEHIYSRFHGELDRKTNKFLRKIAKKIKLPKSGDDYEKIRTIEEFIKSNVRIVSISFSEDILMEELWESNLFTENHAILMMVYLFSHFDIPYQIGVTTDRYMYKFDPDFELWRYADEYIIYFPSIEEYTSVNTYERLGYFDSRFRNNYGLFIEEIELAGVKFGVGNTSFIPKNDYAMSGDTLVVEVDFNEQGLIDTEYNIYHSVSGYKAEYIQPFYEQIDDEDDKKELKEYLINFIDDEAEVIDLEVENLEIASFGINPVVARGKLKSNKFFEKARENYLFKIGELIGPQMEMYSKTERKLPVEDYFTRNYDRKIIFTIPDGYKALNLERLNIHEAYANEEGETIMEFKMNYSIDGNKVIVEGVEYYKDIYYPVEIYKDYQRVINAAADFNKVVVVFEKIE